MGFARERLWADAERERYALELMIAEEGQRLPFIHTISWPVLQCMRK